jgi:hypothetical protein
MIYLSTAFYILLGLLFLGATFQYQEMLIGVCALAIGVIQFIGLLQRD